MTASIRIRNESVLVSLITSSVQCRSDRGGVGGCGTPPTRASSGKVVGQNLSGEARQVLPNECFKGKSVSVNKIVPDHTKSGSILPNLEVKSGTKILFPMTFLRIYYFKCTCIPWPPPKCPTTYVYRGCGPDLGTLKYRW